MIAPARPAPSRRSRSDTSWHAGFLALLPAIVRHARMLLPRMQSEAFEDALAECIANAAVAYARLAKQGKEDLAYASPLAMYAVRQYLDGRRVGNRLNVHEVLSEYAQRHKRFNVGTLDKYDDAEGEWQEAVVQDTRTAPVPEIVSFRVDFADWLGELPRRNRRIAETIAVGNSTGEVAKRFDITAGRVSQLRRELQDSWSQFTDEVPTPDDTTAVTV